jgi:uncharacterized delta-60 repeat protein
VTGAGDVVTAGWSQASTATTSQMQVAEFSSAGALAWQASTSLPNGKANAATVLTSGKYIGDVVAVGYRINSSCAPDIQPIVVALTPAGVLDTTFGTQGIADPNAPCGGQFEAVTTDSAGNIVAAGFIGIPPQTLVARFSLSLTGVIGPDTSFASTGYASLQLGGALTSEANSVAIMGAGPATAGDIVVGGSGDFAVGAPTVLTAAEILGTGANAGTLDPQFGATGFVSTAVPNMQTNGQVQGVAALPNGNVAVAGYQGTSAVVGEWGPTGTPDSSFGNESQNGTAGLEVGGGVVQWNSLVYEPVGDFLITAGTEGPPGGNTTMMIGEYSGTTGAPNVHFASSGIVAASPSGLSAGLNAIAVQPDGRAVAAGQVPTGLVAGNDTEVSLMRVMGPTVSVTNPPITQVNVTGNTTVNFTVSVDEPLSNGATVSVCGSTGTLVAGVSQCGAGTVAANNLSNSSGSVPLVVPISNTAGHSLTVSFLIRSGAGLFVSTTESTASATIQHLPPPPPFNGYWLVNDVGLVYTYGTAKPHGQTNGKPVTPVVGMAAPPSGTGYWILESNGTVLAYGVPNRGQAVTLKLKVPLVGIASDATGNGYWLVASNGAVYAYGDAHNYGGASAVRLPAPIVGIAATPDGLGYWLVGSTGGVYHFGDAGYYGGASASRLAAPITAMAAYPGAGGYWLIESNGYVIPYGAAVNHGSPYPHAAAKVVGILPSPDGGGYLEAAANGTVYRYGDAVWHNPSVAVGPKPIVGIVG